MLENNHDDDDDAPMAVSAATRAQQFAKWLQLILGGALIMLLLSYILYSAFSFLMEFCWVLYDSGFFGSAVGISIIGITIPAWLSMMQSTSIPVTYCILVIHFLFLLVSITQIYMRGWHWFLVVAVSWGNNKRTYYKIQELKAERDVDCDHNETVR